MRRPVGLKDVADRAGKSVSTVSRALAAYDDISVETQTLVRSIAEEMGYAPHAAARQLQSQRTNTVAVVLPATGGLEFTDPFFSDFLAGFVHGLARHGMMALMTSDEEGDPRSPYHDLVATRHVDGFLLLRTKVHDERIDFLESHNVPFAAFGRSGDRPTHAFVDEHSEHAMELLVEHLFELGHRDLACIAEPLDTAKSHHRVVGLIEAMDRRGVPTADIIEAGYEVRDGYSAAAKLLATDRPPVALICCNDRLAVGAVRAALDLGWEVGSEVSITGFDGVALQEQTPLRITTVRHPARESGLQMAEVLRRTIEGEPSDQCQILLDLPLEIGDTSGPPSRTGEHFASDHPWRRRKDE